jgi:hypothetical protein
MLLLKIICKLQTYKNLTAYQFSHPLSFIFQPLFMQVRNTDVLESLSMEHFCDHQAGKNFVL